MTAIRSTRSGVCWGYIRVSGDEQADRGLPVAGQREAIERHAADHGLVLARVFVDEARPGSSDSRADFQRMMRLAQANPTPCQMILIWSWSRFSRDQDDAHFWKASLRRQGIEIVDVSGEMPRVEGFEYVLESLVHWRDEQRLREISADARRGQQALARMGYVPSGCSPPRGFRVEFEEVVIEGRKRRVRRWVPNPETWPLVEKAWQMRLRGASYKTLTAETGLYRTASCWITFFSNPIYKGELLFGGTRLEVPAVVTAEEWARINADRGKRLSGSYARRQGSRFLLSGLLTCARCGSALAGDYGGGGHRKDGYARAQWDHYVCVNRKQGQGCDLIRVDARALERQVIAVLFGEVLTADNLARQVAAIEAQRDSERPALEAQLAATNAQLDEADRAIERLLDAIETAPHSAALTERLTEREAQRDALQRQLAVLRARLEAPVADIDIDALRGQLSEALEHAPPNTARAMLTSIIAEIVVDDREARVRYVLPFGSSTGICSVPPREFESLSQP